MSTSFPWLHLQCRNEGCIDLPSYLATIRHGLATPTCKHNLSKCMCRSATAKGQLLFPRIPPFPHKVCARHSPWWFRAVYRSPLKHLLFSARWSSEEKCLRRVQPLEDLTPSSPQHTPPSAQLTFTRSKGTQRIMGLRARAWPKCVRSSVYVLRGRSWKDAAFHILIAPSHLGGVDIFHRNTLFWSSSSF